MELSIDEIEGLKKELEEAKEQVESYYDLMKDYGKLDLELEHTQQQVKVLTETLETRTEDYAGAVLERDEYYGQVNVLRKAIEQVLPPSLNTWIHESRYPQACKMLEVALISTSVGDTRPMIATPFPMSPIPKPRPMTEEEIEHIKKLVRSPEFKASMKEGLEDIKAGRTRLWSEIRKELDLPHQPKTTTVCPCRIAKGNLCGSCYLQIGHSQDCIILDCDGSGTLTSITSPVEEGN